MIANAVSAVHFRCGSKPTVVTRSPNVCLSPDSGGMSDIPQPLLEPEAEVRRRNNLLILVRVQIALLSLKLQFR
jgi:hypothetical protein